MNGPEPAPEPRPPQPRRDDTYRVAHPPGSTWRPHPDPEAPTPGEFAPSRPDAGATTPSRLDANAPPAPAVSTRRRRFRHPLAQLLLGHLPLETETTYFILVNLLDFFMTYWLLIAGARGNLRFVESNPVARYFIESWGPVKGMLGFKLAVVTFVCVVAQLIAIRREDLGRKVLQFGTLATGAVVAYSLALWVRHG